MKKFSKNFYLFLFFIFSKNYLKISSRNRTNHPPFRHFWRFWRGGGGVGPRSRQTTDFGRQNQ